MGQIEDMSHDAYYDAVRRGLYAAGMQLTKVQTKACLADIAKELGEAIKCLKEDEWTGSENRIPTGFPVEMADIFISLASLCYALGINLETMIHLKMKYNAKRPKLHGRKA